MKKILNHEYGLKFFSQQKLLHRKLFEFDEK
jgi:hypothetical protein